MIAALASRRVLALLVVAGSTAAAQAGPSQPGAEQTRDEDHSACTPAAMTDLRFRSPVPIDEIRVVLAQGSPEGGASEIVVDAGFADRVMTVGQSSQSLSFFPALTGHEFRIWMGPVLEASDSACIDRIELLRAGQPVASFDP